MQAAAMRAEAKGAVAEEEAAKGAVAGAGAHR